MPDLRVIIVDDGRDEDFYDWLFERNQRERAQQNLEGKLVRHDAVRGTLSGGFATVLSATNDGVPPDLILIDHVLSTGGPQPRLVRGGVHLMRRLLAEFAARRQEVPPAVLWTAEFSPVLAHAFVEAGGRHAFSHTDVQAEVAAGLWEVAAGRSRWRHTWTRPYLELTPTDLELLPYLDADWQNHQIAAALSTPGHRLTAETIAERRRKLLGRVNALIRAMREKDKELELEEIIGTNPSTSVAAFAQEHGHVWTPLAYRGDLPPPVGP